MGDEKSSSLSLAMVFWALTEYPCNWSCFLYEESDLDMASEQDSECLMSWKVFDFIGWVFNSPMRPTISTLSSIIMWSLTKLGVQSIQIKEVNSIPYRSVRLIYTVPTNVPIQVDPLFCTRKNIGHTGEIQLFWPIKMFRTGTNKKKKEKEKEEEDEKNGSMTHWLSA